jgi:mRNA interferase MazF
MIHDGQVVLFTFPQTNQGTGKVRPALVIRQLPGGHDDWLLCMISTRISQQVPGVDEVIADTDPEFHAMGLRKPSVIRVTRLAVVAAEILHGSVGQLSPARLQRIRTRLSNWILDESFPRTT